MPPGPKVPDVVLETLSSEIRSPDTFVQIDSRKLVARFEGGPPRGPFPYDVVTRRALDAAVIVAYRGKSVYLRSSVRPPIALRPLAPIFSGVLWELPAGLIEPGEAPNEGAARELEEELGFRVEASALTPLGPFVAPSPAIIGELHYFFCVDVEHAPHALPAGDGSVLEEAAQIQLLPVEDILEMCRRGEIPDAKTELGVRRFAETFQK